MLKIRVAKLIEFTWVVKFNGEVKSLAGVDLEIQVNCPDRNNITVHHTLTEPNIVKFKFRPKQVGLYRFTCYIMDADHHIIAIADRTGFETVPLSCAEQWMDTPELVAEFSYITGDAFIGGVTPAILSYYTTKKDVVQMSYVTYSYLDQKIEDLNIGDYVKQTYLSSQSYVTSTMLDASLDAYINEDELDQILDSYINKDKLDETLNSYINESKLDAVLDSYINKTKLDDTLSSYATISYVKEQVADSKEIWYKDGKYFEKGNERLLDIEFYLYLQTKTYKELLNICINMGDLNLTFSQKTQATFPVYNFVTHANPVGATKYKLWLCSIRKSGVHVEDFENGDIDLSAYLKTNDAKTMFTSYSYINSKKFATESYVAEYHASHAGSVDLSAYLKKVDAKVMYTSYTYIDGKNYADKSYVAEYVAGHSGPVDLSAYLKKVDAKVMYTSYDYVDDEIAKIHEYWTFDGNNYFDGVNTMSQRAFYDHINAMTDKERMNIIIKSTQYNMNCRYVIMHNNKYVFVGLYTQSGVYITQNCQTCSLSVGATGTGGVYSNLASVYESLASKTWAKQNLTSYEYLDDNYTNKNEYDVEEFKFQLEDSSYITKKLAVWKNA